MNKETPVLRKGALAYVDSFVGLLPCKVLSVFNEPIFGAVANVKLTAARGPWKRGEVLAKWSALRVVPRGAVIKRSGKPRIGRYATELDTVLVE